MPKKKTTTKPKENKTNKNNKTNGEGPDPFKGMTVILGNKDEYTYVYAVASQLKKHNVCKFIFARYNTEKALRIMEVFDLLGMLESRSLVMFGANLQNKVCYFYIPGADPDVEIPKI